MSDSENNKNKKNRKIGWRKYCSLKTLGVVTLVTAPLAVLIIVTFTIKPTTPSTVQTTAPTTALPQTQVPSTVPISVIESTLISQTQAATVAATATGSINVESTTNSPIVDSTTVTNAGTSKHDTTTIIPTSGTTTGLKIESCQTVKQGNPGATSGLYNITIELLTITVWCDMVSNGGGYIFFLKDSNFEKITQRTLDLLFTDKTQYLLTLKKATAQNYCTITQLDAYSSILFQSFIRSTSVAIPAAYAAPIQDSKIGPPYLYWPVMTNVQASTPAEHGIKINGVVASYINTIGTCEYLALFPKTTGAGNDGYANTYPYSATVFNGCDSILGQNMPDDAFFFLEMHFQTKSLVMTDGRADAVGVLGANIGMR